MCKRSYSTSLFLVQAQIDISFITSIAMSLCDEVAVTLLPQISQVYLQLSVKLSLCFTALQMEHVV